MSCSCVIALGVNCFMEQGELRLCSGNPGVTAGSWEGAVLPAERPELLLLLSDHTGRRASQISHALPLLALFLVVQLLYPSFIPLTERKGQLGQHQLLPVASWTEETERRT